MDDNENIKTAETEDIKSRIDWNKRDIIFFAILAPFIFLAEVVILIPTGGLSYLSGFYNFPFDFLFVGLVVVNNIGKVMIAILFPFAVGGFLFIIISSIRAFITWKKYTRRKRIIRTAQIGIPILLIILFIYAFFVPIELYQPRYKPFTHGFRNRIRIIANVGAIRKWLGTLDKEHCDGNYITLSSGSYPFIKYWPDEWPISLIMFSPNSVILDLDENNNPKVRLEWGSALGHWGFEVGMKDMEIPESDFSRRGEYRLTVEPGVYVWYDLQ